MRLIDADALLEELKKTYKYFDLKFYIEDAPTIDVNKLQTPAEQSDDIVSKRVAIYRLLEKHNNILATCVDDYDRGVMAGISIATDIVNALPSAEPNIDNGEVSVSDMAGDLVSRQLLIGAIKKCGEEKIYPQALIQTINALPSAVPQDHDGCDGCLHRKLPEYEYPCKECKQNYRDLYEWDVSPSADRPKFKLELITEIVRQLRHLDDYVADTCDRPQGEWVVENHEVVCSVCGQNNLETNFCPNCGADMRGEK